MLGQVRHTKFIFADIPMYWFSILTQYRSRYLRNRSYDIIYAISAAISNVLKSGFMKHCVVLFCVICFHEINFTKSLCKNWRIFNSDTLSLTKKLTKQFVFTFELLTNCNIKPIVFILSLGICYFHKNFIVYQEWLLKVVQWGNTFVLKLYLSLLAILAYAENKHIKGMEFYLWFTHFSPINKFSIFVLLSLIFTGINK